MNSRADWPRRHALLLVFVLCSVASGVVLLSGRALPMTDLPHHVAQIALGAVDLCYQLCGLLGSGSCHSHGPLFDNVTIKAREPFDFVVTNTADSSSGSFRQAILAANASPDRNRIVFDIPGAGPHTISPLAPLPKISWPVVIDATTQPGYAGAPIVALSGVSAGAGAGLRLDASQSVITGLAIHDFAGDGIIVRGDTDTIRGNYIGLTPAQAPASNSGHGISMFFSIDATVGGAQTQDANVIAYNGGNGVNLHPTTGFGNALRGNSIHSNTGMGIDLDGNGITPNDTPDTDGRQNYPILDVAVAGVNIVAGSLNTTPSSDLVIDLYASAVCDSNGFGEGERFLGSTQVTTGSAGNGTFNTTVAGTLSVGEQVTATATDSLGNTSEFSQCVTVEPEPTGVPEDPIIPERLALFQNAPNPFNPTTVIRYDVPAGGATVQLVVFDVLGRHVRTLVDGFETAGRKRVTWDSRNAGGHRVATGVYFVRMQAGSFVQTRKMVLLK